MGGGFLFLKTLHVLSAIVALGANVTHALWRARSTVMGVGLFMTALVVAVVFVMVFKPQL